MTRRSGWLGWIVFAGIMMMVLGAFQAIEGLVALFNSGFYVVEESGLIVNVNYTAWGWVHLGIGVLAVLIGAGVMTGNTAARIGGIALASISAIVNLAFISAYPVWAVVVIAIDVIVIYALAVHGREMRMED
ncbi:hypothetical protein BLA60_23450 [Actinophytocola xinjiangensis]|uniref:DUF7144 domain-containing protein n=1 Tax=Actinophytocola xinjiangensis TaxID=485602 RepID=A0A7Z0WKT7_9PSEU|nr:hypothetical protein BLA60_23450 [Actinophytocola xinjiangensis]